MALIQGRCAGGQGGRMEAADEKTSAALEAAAAVAMARGSCELQAADARDDSRSPAGEASRGCVRPQPGIGPKLATWHPRHPTRSGLLRSVSGSLRGGARGLRGGRHRRQRDEQHLFQP